MFCREYRIICHKLHDPVPLDRMQIDTDLNVQLKGFSGRPISTRQLEDTRLARYELNSVNSSTWREGTIGEEYIDRLMGEVPGKDNYNADHFDDAFGVNATNYDGTMRLNTAYYTRYYAIPKDAMGRTTQRRSFNDPTMWAAMTSQPRVMGVTACTAEIAGGEGINCGEATIKAQKWSYAIPLEIIYLTPLSRWNPYNLSHCPASSDSSQCWTKRGNRDGKLTPDKAYNGTATNVYYQTPKEFFGGRTASDTDPADTAAAAVGVLDQQGVVREVSASGHWIHFPPIVTFDRPVRQRYPIAPVHEHGSASWKETKALQDLLMGDSTSISIQNALNEVKEERLGVTLALGFTNSAVAGAHGHTFHVTGDELQQMDAGNAVEVETSINNGHNHKVKKKKKGGEKKEKNKVNKKGEGRHWRDENRKARHGPTDKG